MGEPRCYAIDDAEISQPPGDLRAARSPGGVLDDGDLLCRQPIKLADEAADLLRKNDFIVAKLSPPPAAFRGRACSRNGSPRLWWAMKISSKLPGSNKLIYFELNKERLSVGGMLII